MWKLHTIMALIIIGIILLGFLLIITENYTNVNKAAVAIFMGTVGWILYISYGTDFVISQHLQSYQEYLAGAMHTSENVKEFIAQNIFLHYLAKASGIALFLIATMAIVEILDNNGCFDFIEAWVRTRNSKVLLWKLAIATFILSANLDNLTTTVMILMLIHKLIPSRQYRLLYGSVAVISANCGGALTVIGSPEGLVLWNMGAITATDYSLHLLLPCLAAWIIPTYWISRTLPESMKIEFMGMPYRGDDTNLNVWQRVVMLFVGIGGLWFIPTFHTITKLSPFLGALCVLCVLWVINEIFNRKLANVEVMVQRRKLRILQYGSTQLILFVVGIMLTMGVLGEIGVFNNVSDYLNNHVANVWIIGALLGLLSSVLDNFANGMTAISLYSVHSHYIPAGQTASEYALNFIQNGTYWKVIAFTSAIFGSILPIGSMSGLALMKENKVRLSWYFNNIGIKALVGGLIGYLILWIIIS